MGKEEFKFTNTYERTGKCYIHSHKRLGIEVELQHLLSKPMGKAFRSSNLFSHLGNNNSFFNDIYKVPGM